MRLGRRVGERSLTRDMTEPVGRKAKVSFPELRARMVLYAISMIDLVSPRLLGDGNAA